MVPGRSGSSGAGTCGAPKRPASAPVMAALVSASPPGFRATTACSKLGAVIAQKATCRAVITEPDLPLPGSNGRLP